MQKYEEASKLSRKQIIINNFLGGISWAVGSTIGLTLVISLLTFLLSKANLVPLLGNWFGDISHFAQIHNQQMGR